MVSEGQVMFLVTGKLVRDITNGEMCDLCDKGWHELYDINYDGEIFKASVLCVATGKRNDIIVSVSD